MPTTVMTAMSMSMPAIVAVAVTIAVAVAVIGMVILFDGIVTVAVAPGETERCHYDQSNPRDSFHGQSPPCRAVRYGQVR